MWHLTATDRRASRSLADPAARQRPVRRPDRSRPRIRVVDQPPSSLPYDDSGRRPTTQFTPRGFLRRRLLAPRCSTPTSSTTPSSGRACKAARALITERAPRGGATPAEHLAVIVRDEMPDEDRPRRPVRAWATLDRLPRCGSLSRAHHYVGMVETLADEADRDDRRGRRDVGRPRRRLEPQPHHLRRRAAPRDRSAGWPVGEVGPRLQTAARGAGAGSVFKTSRRCCSRRNGSKCSGCWRRRSLTNRAWRTSSTSPSLWRRSGPAWRECVSSPARTRL